jgi:hypothetical protein
MAGREERKILYYLCDELERKPDIVGDNPSVTFLQ